MVFFDNTTTTTTTIPSLTPTHLNPCMRIANQNNTQNPTRCDGVQLPQLCMEGMNTFPPRVFWRGRRKGLGANRLSCV